MALGLPLLPDEANTWQWSRHLAAGYYDNGPLVAFTVRAGTFLLGPTLAGIRLSGILLGLGGSFLIYDTARVLFRDRRLGLALVVALNSTLLMGVGGILATYDLPQVFFWALSLDLAARLFFLERPGGRSLLWLALGVSLGLSMLAKYSSLLLPLGLAGYLVCSRERRGLLLQKGPYLAALAAFLTFLPNLVWNMNHGFQAFYHVLGLGQGGRGWRFETPEFMGAQALFIGPVLFVLLLIGLAKALASARRGDRAQRFLLWTWLPTLGLFGLMSLWTKTYGNWTGPGYGGAFLAAAGALAPAWRKPGPWRKWAAVGLLSGYLILGLAYAHRPILNALGLEPDRDPTAEMYGWSELGPALDKALADWPQARRPFIFSTRYQMASLAAFHASGKPETVGLFPLPERFNQYLYWSRPEELKGRDGLAVIKLDRSTDQKNLLWAGTIFELELTQYYRFQLYSLFEEVGPGRVVELHGPGGRVINRAALFRCRNFLGVDERNRGPGYIR